jgi:hypothetical protein
MPVLSCCIVDGRVVEGGYIPRSYDKDAASTFIANGNVWQLLLQLR